MSRRAGTRTIGDGDDLIACKPTVSTTRELVGQS
jgi:hypothetical protein